MTPYGKSAAHARRRMGAILVLVCHPLLAGPPAYITSCCSGGSSVSFLDNARNTETGFMATSPSPAVAFSPDSQTAYVATNSAIQVVDVTTRKVTSSFPDANGPTAIAISPDGATAYVTEIGPGNGTVTAFRLPQGQVIAVITITVSYQCTDVKFSPDGARLYAACQRTPLDARGDNTFSVIDPSQNTVLQSIQTKGDGYAGALAIAPDGSTAYMSVGGRRFNGYAVIDLSTLTITATPSLPGLSGGLALAPDGSALYSSQDRYIYKLTPSTGKVLAKIKLPAQGAGLAMAPDGSRLYAADYGANEVSVIDPATSKMVKNIPTGGLPAHLAISPNGKTTITTSAGSTLVDVVDSATGAPTGAFEAGGYPSAVALSSDGTRAFVVDQGPTAGYALGAGVMVIDTANFKRISQIPVGGAYTVAMLPDDSAVYCGQDFPPGSPMNGRISVIDPSTYKVKSVLVLGGLNAYPTLAASPDSSRLYAAYTDLSGQTQLAFIAASSNTVLQTISLGAGGTLSAPALALSPDGTRAYVTLPDAGQVAIVDTMQNQLITKVTLSRKYPVGIAVHPGGKLAYVVSYLAFNGIDVLDLTSNKVTATIAAPGHPVPFNVAFTPDGSKAYMTEELGPVLIIDTATQKIVKKLPFGNSNSIGVTIASH